MELFKKELFLQEYKKDLKSVELSKKRGEILKNKIINNFKLSGNTTEIEIRKRQFFYPILFYPILNTEDENFNFSILLKSLNINYRMIFILIGLILLALI